MATVTWSLQVNAGALQTLYSLGIDRLTVSRRSLAVGEMIFTVQTGNIFQEPFCVYGDMITLWRNAVRWWMGTVTQLPAVGTAGNEAQRYVVSDAWWKLQRIIYQQPYVLKTGDFSAYTGSMTSHVTLGQDEWGNKLTTDQQIFKICTYAALGVAASLPTLSNTFIQDGRDMTCADAIRRMMSLNPDAVTWFTFDTGAPVLNIQPNANLTLATLDASPGLLIETIGDLTPRYDLQVSGVVITFMGSVQDPATKLWWAKETRQTAGSISGDGVICATIELNNQGLTTAETPPAGLAVAYYNSRRIIPWQGSLTLHEQECTGTLAVGQRLNLTNGRAGWATMFTTVQTVTEDIFNGRTEVTLGAPDHLGLQDFIGMMLAFQKRPGANTFATTRNNGDAGYSPIGANPADPSGPGNSNAGNLPPPGIFQTVDVNVCLAGVTKTLRLVGSIAS